MAIICGQGGWMDSQATNNGNSPVINNQLTTNNYKVLA